MTAVIEQVLVAVRTTIQGLSLTGIDSANIVDMLLGDDQGGSGPNVGGYPCIICCYNPAGGETIDPTAGTNVSDDIEYPVQVIIIATENRDQTTNRTRNWTWRDSIITVFHQKRLSGVTGGVAWRCLVRPGTSADRPRWLQQQHAQVLVVTVTVRKGRT